MISTQRTIQNMTLAVSPPDFLERSTFKARLETSARISGTLQESNGVAYFDHSTFGPIEFPNDITSLILKALVFLSFFFSLGCPAHVSRFARLSPATLTNARYSNIQIRYDKANRSPSLEALATSSSTELPGHDTFLQHMEEERSADHQSRKRSTHTPATQTHEERKNWES